MLKALGSVCFPASSLPSSADPEADKLPLCRSCEADSLRTLKAGGLWVLLT